MARQSILGIAGDFLPTYRIKETVKRGKTKRRVYRDETPHKDGETPGQEWSRREILAIRTLANPETATPEKAARACKCTVRTIKSHLKNPYFMNAIYVLTNSNLMQARARVINAVIENACSGSAQDRTLFLRLTGDLKDEKKIKMEQHQHHTFGDFSDSELDGWIKDDIETGGVDGLIDDSHDDKEPGGE